MLENGIKDCTNCTLPHNRENYDYVISRFQDIADTMSTRKEADHEA